MKLLLLCLFVAVLLIYSGYIGMRKTRTVNDFFLRGGVLAPGSRLSPMAPHIFQRLFLLVTPARRAGASAFPACG